MSLLLLAEARALVDSDLGDPDLQGVIDREESFGARRIGALAGSRVQTFLIYGEDRPLQLQRPASSVTVTDNAVATTNIRLIGEGYLVESTKGAWTGPVVITSTPNDLNEVKRVIVEAVRLALSASAYTDERHGTYSYSKPEPLRDQATREALWRSLLHGGPATVRLRSVAESDRVGAVL